MTQIMTRISSPYTTVVLFLITIFGPTLTRASTIRYDAILAIVIVELIFAFSVGVVCIIFSFNLLRALKESAAEYSDLPIGDLPARNRSAYSQLGSHFGSAHAVSSSADLNSAQAQRRRRSSDSQHDYRTFSEERLCDVEAGNSTDSVHGTPPAAAAASDEDEEEDDESLWGLINIFASYLRLW